MLVIEVVSSNRDRSNPPISNRTAADYMNVRPDTKHDNAAGLTLAITNLKGGVGKSVLTGLIAAEFAQQGASVHVVDCDEQQSTTRWHTVSRQRGYRLEGIGLTAIPAAQDFHTAVASIPASDIRLFDVGGFFHDRAVEAYKQCDAVLIPVINEATSATQAMAIRSILETNGKEMQRPVIPYKAIFNNLHPFNINSPAVAETAKILVNANFPLAKPIIKTRDYYARVAAGWGTLYDWRAHFESNPKLTPSARQKALEPVYGAIEGVNILNNEIIQLLREAQT